MKRLTTFFVLLSLVVAAQPPPKMNYQAVIRDNESSLVTNQQIGMQISILQGNINGSVVYAEIQTPITNANGLVSIIIGDGDISNGDLSEINWNEGPYFIKTETDIDGGTNYTISGTSQLMSVPFAFHATTAESLTEDIEETDPIFSQSIAASITSDDTTHWGVTETDPVFNTSVASEITSSDINNWNNKFGGDYNNLQNSPTDLGDFTNNAGYQLAEDDNDTDYENEIQKLYSNKSTKTIGIDHSGGLVYIPDVEGDPIYKASVASGITSNDTAKWNNNAISDTISITETDPVFSTSQAANIDANDITNLGYLSGTNTGDQDISGIAINAQAIKDTAIQIRANIPDVGSFISSEKDPIYANDSASIKTSICNWNSSIAKNITTADTARWGNGLPTASSGNLLTYDGNNWVAKDLAITVDSTGAGQAFSNIQPSLAVNFVIALDGTYPTRSSISDPTIGEISIFAGSFAPSNHAFCNGQTLSISSYMALFSILGTIYGGNGTSTFALPDLRGRVPVHFGQGSGLINRQIGTKFGSETTTLTNLNLPEHTHTVTISYE